MRATRALHLLSLIPVLVLLTSGCLFSPPEKPPLDPDPVIYHAYTHPDSLVANFVLAWEGMEHVEYRDRILYNGIEAAPDGEDYKHFIFYFVPEGVDIWGEPLPSLQTYDEEESNIQRMFSGNQGKNDTPGVRSIALTLTKNSDWAPPTNSQHVEGDPYPEGTKRCVFTSEMLVTLKGTVPNSDTTAYQVADNLEFHVIPVLVNEGTENERTEYRIWKWRDLATG